MKIGICSALACKLDDSLKYIGVDHGVEILLKQGLSLSLQLVILIRLKTRMF